MSLIIRGIKINTGETFHKKAVLGIEKIKNQFILKNFDVYIALKKINTKLFNVKILFNNKEYGTINVRTVDEDAIYALSIAITKIEKIIRRLNRKLKSKKRLNLIKEQPPLESNKTEFSDDSNDGLIIANMNYKIEKLSVADAAKKLAKSNNKTLMFRNAAHMGLNLLLKNTNGTIEWIDPRGFREAIKL